ncbi:MAG: hypothetical protein Q9180_003168 [Flavoplaca navasiana]
MGDAEQQRFRGTSVTVCASDKQPKGLLAKLTGRPSVDSIIKPLRSQKAKSERQPFAPLVLRSLPSHLHLRYLQTFRHTGSNAKPTLYNTLGSFEPGLPTMALLETIIKSSLSTAVSAVLRSLTPIARLLHVLVSEMRK